MKAPGSKRSQLEHKELLSNFAFMFNLRRYIQGALMTATIVTLGATFWYGTLLAIAGQLTAGRCRLTVPKSVFKALIASALGAITW